MRPPNRSRREPACIEASHTEDGVDIRAANVPVANDATDANCATKHCAVQVGSVHQGPPPIWQAKCNLNANRLNLGWFDARCGVGLDNPRPLAAWQFYP